MGAAYRLTFMLPPSWRLSVPPGRYHPCVAGCVVVLERSFRALIEAPSRERAFAQVRALARDLGRGHGPADITMALYSPGGGSDSWTAIVGAQVAIVPGRITSDLGGEYRLSA